MPYRLDFFAIFIFLGIVQAVFLSFFFLSRENRKLQPNLFHGILLLSMALCILEIFLMYSGYIINMLHLVDFSEPISFLIGPAFYLMVYSMIHGKVERVQYLHFLFAVIYLILLIPFLLHSEDYKYNSWIYSFHPELPYRAVTESGDGRGLWVTNHHTKTTMIHLIIYGGLGLFEVVKAFRKSKESFFRTTNPVLKKLRIGVFEILTTVAVMIIIKIFNYHDTGDHMLAAYISFAIYLTSFSVMRNSGFFQQASLTEVPKKYKGSSVSPDLHQQTLQKLKDLMEKEKLYCRADFSLPELAQRLGVSVHALSQVINEGMGKSFFEMSAMYRVEEAKRLLRDQPHVKVEEIAEQVGYLSKSSFNTAFKKLTGKTPSEYRSTGS
jgi:AraC-like DNA-binding protein